MNRPLSDICRESLRYNVYNWLKNIDKEIEINVFMGGSELFGWNTEFSDIDFFICPCYEDSDINHVLNKIYDAFFENGFVFSNDKDDNLIHTTYAGLGSVFHNKRLNIHIILIEDHKKWTDLRKEHERIEKYIKNNPNVLKFIKNLKSKTSIKGAYIYRSIRDML